jgi:hypothetical protein
MIIFIKQVKKKSDCQYNHFYLHPLAFYSKFSQVIGFSGSITYSDINKFLNLFGSRKQLLYYEMPAFFGPVNMDLNRTFDNSPGQIIENREDFCNAVRHEVKQKYKSQPILIFAENEKWPNEDKSDYECLQC